MNIDDVVIEASLRDDVTRPAEKIRRQVKGLGDDARKSDREAGRSTRGWDKFTRGLGKVGRTGGKLLKAGLIGAAAGVAAAGAGLAVVFAKGFTEAVRRQDLTAGLQASLGVNAKTAGRLGRDASKVYAEGWGASIGEVSAAIEQVRTSIPGMEKATGRSLRRMTTDALGLAQTFGLDVGSSVDMIRSLVTNGLAKDGRQATDMLTKALQGVPSNLRQEVVDSLHEYSTHFATFGLDGSRSLAMLADSAKSLGTYGIDKVGDSIKELSIRASDMSKNTQAALSGIGMDPSKTADAIAKGGPAAAKALKSITDGLLAIESPGERANTAIALFGTPLEDMSVQKIPEFLKALGSVDTGLGKYEGSAKKAQKALGSTPGAEFTKWKRRAEEGIVRFIEDHILPALDHLGPMFEAVGRGVETVGRWFRKSKQDSDGLGGAFEDLHAFGSDVADMWEVMGPVVRKLAKVYFNHLVDRIRLTAKVLRTLGSIGKWLWNEIYQPVITKIAGGFASLIENIVPTLRAISQAPGMEWVGRLADDLEGAATQARWVEENLKKIPNNKVIHVDYKVRGNPNGSGMGGAQDPTGDTATRRGRTGALAGTLALHDRTIRATGARPTITNIGHGGGSGDHENGRALDLVGKGLAKYGAHVRAEGGYAAFHGTGRGRHLHAVPRGDTNISRTRSGGGSSSGPNITFGPGSVVVNNPAADVDVEAAIANALRKAKQEETERKVGA